MQGREVIECWARQAIRYAHATVLWREIEAMITGCKGRGELPQWDSSMNIRCLAVGCRIATAACIPATTAPTKSPACCTCGGGGEQCCL
eukprot:1159715-Pelagomonas_calceolata.AAC.12